MARTNVEAEAFLGEFRRYASILTSRVANDQQPKFDGESATAVQVERGIVYPRALLNPAALDISPADRLIELSNSPRSVTVMGKVARLTVAVISSALTVLKNFQLKPPPISRRTRRPPPAQKVRLRRYQTGILRLGVLSMDSLVGDDPGGARGEPGCVRGEPGCVSAGSGLGGEIGGLVVGVIGRYLALVEL